MPHPRVCRALAGLTAGQAPGQGAGDVTGGMAIHPGLIAGLERLFMPRPRALPIGAALHAIHLGPLPWLAATPLVRPSGPSAAMGGTLTRPVSCLQDILSVCSGPGASPKGLHRRPAGAVPVAGAAALIRDDRWR